MHQNIPRLDLIQLMLDFSKPLGTSILKQKKIRSYILIKDNSMYDILGFTATDKHERNVFI